MQAVTSWSGRPQIDGVVYETHCEPRRVDTAAVRSGPQEQRGKKRGRRRQEKESAASSAADQQPGQRYYPVLCDVCDTEMGVQSADDEVFTFHNVVPSAA